jgi:hypothetical protein
MELKAENVTEYLRSTGRLPAEGKGEVLVQALSGQEGPARSTVLKVFDPEAGAKVGSDVRSPAQIKAGKPDTRMSEGVCLLVKQPLEGARQKKADEAEEEDPWALSKPTESPESSEARFALGLARVRAEKSCMELLSNLLPEGSVPANCWVDEDECILGTDCAPASAISWKKQLSNGITTGAVATHAGMLLAMLHSSTKKDPAVRERFGDAKLFSQARLEPGILSAGPKNPDVIKMLQDAVFRARTPLCLLHGDFVPANILLVPEPGSEEAANAASAAGSSTGGKGFELASLMLVDYDAAYFGHAAFDVASLISELLLGGFMRSGKWRAMMMLADNFWQTYRHTADPDLVRGAEVAGGRIMGALMLGRVDGARPLQGLADRRGAGERIRKLAGEILKKSTISLDEAIDAASMHYDTD